MQLDFKSLTPNQRYGVMTQTIVPRPIAWVLSDNGDDSFNLAPFSYFTGICSDPPILVLSIGKKNALEEKDTRVNIRERENFVVHIPSTDNIDQVNASSASLAHGESEVDIANLDLVDIDGFSLPRIQTCDIAFACRVYRIDQIGNVEQAVIYGEIVSLYAKDELLVKNDKGRFELDAKKLDPLARLGGSQYSALGNILSTIRPK